MSKSIKVGQVMCKYYIEDGQMKVIEGVVVNRGGKKWVAFDSKTNPDETFPGHRNIDRVWKNGDILWLTERDDALAKQLYTEFYTAMIKDLQRQIDNVGDVIEMIRKVKIKSGTSRHSKCFGEINTQKRVRGEADLECERTYREGWDVSELVDVDHYARRKIDMLKREMFIDITIEETQHIKSLKTHTAIDAAVRAVINKHWK